MSKLGFYCFTQRPMPVVPTLRQQVKALSDSQRQELIVSFRDMIPAEHLDHKMGLSKEIIKYVYDGIDRIQDNCRSLMRGEVVITPAVTHLDLSTLKVVIDTPAVMNTQPATQPQLRTAVSSADLLEDYPQAFITNVVQELVSWCKYDGTGTFAFYKSQIIL